MPKILVVPFFPDTVYYFLACLLLLGYLILSMDYKSQIRPFVRLSVCLSSVCNVRIPYSAVEAFSNFFTAVYLGHRSSDLRAKFYGDRPRGHIHQMR